MSYPILRQSRGWSSLMDLPRHMDRMLSDFWSPSYLSRCLSDVDMGFSPNCDVEETDSHFSVSLDLAGVPRDQVKVEFIDNRIVISGEREELLKQQGRENDFLYSERKFGKFQRSFVLPPGVDIENVTAAYQDGVLCVRIPKALSSKARQIKVADGFGAVFIDKKSKSEKKNQPFGISSLE